MIEFICVGIVYLILVLLSAVRLAKGPSSADRAVAADAMDILLTAVLIIVALISGRSIYLDIAIVMVMLGFIGTVLIAKYLEGSLK